MSGRLPSAGLTVRTRLLAAVVLPLLLVAATVGQVVVDRRATVRATDELRARTLVLADLATLRTRIFEERRQYETVARSAEVGLDAEQVAQILGIEVEADPTRARAGTDQALRALAPDQRPFLVDALESLRTGLDAGELSTDDASARFAALESLVVRDVDALLGEVGDRAVEIGDLPIEQTVRTMRDTVEIASARGRQLQDLAFQLFPSGDGSSAAIVALAQSTVRFETLALRLNHTSVAEVAEAWAKLETSGRHFDQVIAAELIGQGTGLTGDYLAAGRVLGDGLANYEGLTALPEIALGSVAASTMDRGAAAKADAEQAVAAAALLIALAIGFAVWFGRSITRPIDRLTRHARRVRDGEVAVEPLPLSGPPELVVASAAFNDVTENLKLIEQKALALSDGDFASPALREPLPGRLGDALTASLQLLSSSIIERQHLQSRLVHQATHDSLTGLVNRRAAIDALTAAVARARRSGQPVAVTFIDLDDFKATNDMCGHAMGDALLQAIARRLQGAARRGDVVARLGGDEFVVIAEQVDGIDEALTLVRRILDAVAAPIDIDGREFRITASAGIALDARQGDDAMSLLAKADLAVYRAKQAAASSIELYDEQMQQLVRARTETEVALAATLAAGGPELTLHYQPVLGATTGEVVSVEALVRWERPDVGCVPPDQFIPVAESSDLIVALDLWVLQHATRQLASWRGHPVLGQVSLAVNISGRHITDPEFANRVATVLSDSGITPSRLILEVTETALVADLDRAATQVDAVRAMGVQVAVDDFGTGHTGLAHIRAMALDEIKIDKSFTAEVPEITHLIRIIVYLAGHLGVTTVAEGVETADQARALRDLGCTFLQGYFFSPALPVPELEHWVRDHRRVTTAQPRRLATRLG